MRLISGDDRPVRHAEVPGLLVTKCDIRSQGYVDISLACDVGAEKTSLWVERQGMGCYTRNIISYR
jgi:hypothetical protein